MRIQIAMGRANHERMSVTFERDIDTLEDNEDIRNFVVYACHMFSRFHDGAEEPIVREVCLLNTLHYNVYLKWSKQPVDVYVFED